MRAVVQRVSRASVTVADEVVARMGPGLLALVGVEQGDTLQDAEDLARRLVRMRIFEDEQGRMNRSLLEAGTGLTVVSQFSLLGDLRKGLRPSFGAAATPEQAEPLIEAVIEAARGLGAPVVSGRFRAHMSVELVNDGPVTLLVDTRKLF